MQFRMNDSAQKIGSDTGHAGKFVFKMPFRIVACLILCTAWIGCSAQSPVAKTMNIYLFPGQGSDYRIFQNLQFSLPAKVNYISYPVPEKEMTMRTYAISLMNQIDTTEPFVLIGVSLGGMLCSELSGICRPEMTIIISSASGYPELPARYTFMRKLPVYKFIPAVLFKAGAFIAQPIIEPDRRHGRKTFNSMLRAKDPVFIKRTTKMIINWNRKEPDTKIVHIHGTFDHTLPVRKVHPDYIISKGSHMMTYTRGSEISKLINELINN
jgi:pimeloyl-ACP methyl ester carboxylesterase